MPTYLILTEDKVFVACYMTEAIAFKEYQSRLKSHGDMFESPDLFLYEANADKLEMLYAPKKMEYWNAEKVVLLAVRGK